MQGLHWTRSLCYNRDAVRGSTGSFFLRNALAAAPLCEDGESVHEIRALDQLILTLFLASANDSTAENRLIDEAEPLVLRFRAAARAHAARDGLNLMELKSIYALAQLHEVLSILIPRGDPPSHCLTLHSLQGR